MASCFKSGDELRWCGSADFYSILDCTNDPHNVAVMGSSDTPKYTFNGTNVDWNLRKEGLVTAKGEAAL